MRQWRPLNAQDVKVMALIPTIYMAVGIRLSKQSQWVPTLPFGSASPIIELTFEVGKMNAFKAEESGESSRGTVTMSIQLIGDVSVQELHLVDMENRGGNVIAELDFYSNGAVKIKVRHAGQAKNDVTSYQVVSAQFDQLKVYLQANYPHLVQFLPSLVSDT